MTWGFVNCPRPQALASYFGYAGAEVLITILRGCNKSPPRKLMQQILFAFGCRRAVQSNGAAGSFLLPRTLVEANLRSHETTEAGSDGLSYDVQVAYDP